MEFVNETPLQAGWCLGFQPDGRELLVVAVKATYALVNDGGDLALAESQMPLTKADQFTHTPGLSATLYETDYSHRKPACDVLVNGSAHAPDARPVGKVTVGLRVGPIRKRFEVVGDRVWERSPLRTAHTEPSPFIKLPISYDRAYGGVDRSEDDPGKIQSYADNPVGVGYYPVSKGKELVGKPLPNTQEIGRPASERDGTYRPMSFGPIGRNFKSRIPYAGTYDRKWLDERVPYFPDDFDYRYFQCAPEDQQMPYPAGGEEVVLENLTRRGLTRFRLPKREMPVLVIPHVGDAFQLDGVVDTVFIEPDEGRVMLTWRASLPLRKSCFDIRRVVVEKGVRQHVDDTRRATKVHYASLDELVRTGRQPRGR